MKRRVVPNEMRPNGATLLCTLRRRCYVKPLKVLTDFTKMHKIIAREKMIL